MQTLIELGYSHGATIEIAVWSAIAVGVAGIVVSTIKWGAK